MSKKKKSMAEDVLHEYKKNKCRLRAIEDTQLGQIRKADTNEQIILKSYIETVDYILNQLTAKQQKILRMSYLNNCSMVRISNELNYNYEYTSLLKVTAAKEFEELITHTINTSNSNITPIYELIKNVQNELNK